MWASSLHMNEDHLYNESRRLIQKITGSTETLFRVLRSVATPEAINDEINRSIRALAGAPQELMREDPKKINMMTVFFPSNNILYSYVLYCLIPGLYCDTILLRPSSRAKQATMDVHGLLGASSGSHVWLRDVTQKDFIEESGDADLVVFTGTSRNATAVQKKLPPGPTLISFASASTPVVVAPGADVYKTARNVIAARLFNEGRDCLCPDAILVHDNLFREFIKSLKAQISEYIHARNRNSNDLPRGHNVDPSIIETLQGRNKSIVHGGILDNSGGKIAPTIIEGDLTRDFVQTEWYGPVFDVVRYERDHDLESWFLENEQLSTGSYVSVFGKFGAGREMIGTHLVLRNLMPLDAEHPNLPFGGYGQLSGSVRNHGHVVSRPLLISAEVCRRQARAS